MKPTDYKNTLNQVDFSDHGSEPSLPYPSHSLVHRLIEEAEQAVTQSTMHKISRPEQKLIQTPKKAIKTRSPRRVRYSYD